MCKKTAVWTLLLSLSVAMFSFAQTESRPAQGIKLNSRMFGAIQARSIGPAVMGGRIMAIEGVARSPRIIWVASASGGVWKSINGGVTFKPVFDKYTQSIGALAVDQQHPDTVWVGTGEGCVRNSVSVGTGVYKTTDGGESWQLMGLEDSERISRILIDPKDPNTVYVAALGHLWDDNEERGLYKTTDGGKTWQRILFVNERTGCADVELDPQQPNILYAAMWEFRRLPYFFESGGKGSGLYRSLDGGKTWEKLTAGLPEGPLGRIAIAVAPSRPSTLYAVVESKNTALYRSDDLGEHWRRLDASFNIKARPFYFAHLEVDPGDFNRVYKPGLSLSVSEDGGKSFTSPFFGGSGAVHSDHHALWIDPGNPLHLLLGTDGGIYVSYDRGHTWRFLNNLPVSQFYHVAVDENDPYNVYGGLQDNGSWYGPSASPAGIENRDWENIGGGDGFCVIPDREDPDFVYLESQVGNLVRFRKSTGESKEIRPYPEAGGPKLRFNWNTPVLLSQHHPHKLFVGSQFLFVSYDRGESWKRISPDLTTNDPDKQHQNRSGGLTRDDSGAENYCTIFTISESPLDSSVIWVGTDDGNLQLTRDGGHTWSNLADRLPGLPPNTWCSSVEASHHQAGRAFATFDGHRTGDRETYVFRTDDFGQNWTRLPADGVEGYAHVIREDPVNPNLLFLGTEFGLYVSLDGGQQWARFSGNLPKVSVRDLVIHPRESDLVLATHGRGIYIIDDITPLRQITPEILAADVAMLPARPSKITLPRFVQQFSGDGEFVGENPPEAAVITYYLKKRHLFGDLYVEIYDSTGKLIKKLPGGKRRGINRVAWNMRMKPPRVAPSPKLAPWALFGPTVPEGTYSVRLVKGKKTYTTRIRLVADPRLGHSRKDRLLRHQTVMKLYRMQEDLAYIGDALLDMRKQAQSYIRSLKRKNSTRRALERFVKQIDGLREQLVVTENVTWVSQEERLRERVVDLYGAVSAYGGRPSPAQLARMRELAGELSRAEQQFRRIVDKELPKLNRRLRGKKLEPIRVKSRDAWEAETHG